MDNDESIVLIGLCGEYHLTTNNIGKMPKGTLYGYFLQMEFIGGIGTIVADFHLLRTYADGSYYLNTRIFYVAGKAQQYSITGVYFVRVCISRTNCPCKGRGKDSQAHSWHVLWLMSFNFLQRAGAFRQIMESRIHGRNGRSHFFLQPLILHVVEFRCVPDKMSVTASPAL